MVQMFDPLDVGGQIGQGLGKGLGDQLNREVQATRLGDQIQSLKDAYSDPKKAVDPIDLMGSLTQMATRLGPEQGAAFLKVLPQIQQSILARQTIDQPDSQPTADMRPGADMQPTGGASMDREAIADLRRPSVQGRQTSSDIIESMDAEQRALYGELAERGQDPFSIQDSETLQALQQTPFRYTPQQLENRTMQIVRQTGMDRVKAREEALLYEDRVNQYRNDLINMRQTQMGLEDEVRSVLDSELRRQLQVGSPSQEGDPLFAKLPGEVYSNLENMAIRDLYSDKKLSPQVVVKRVAQDARRFSKAQDEFNAKTSPGWTSFLLGSNESIKNWQDNIGKYHDAYAKVGAENIFYEKLLEKGLTEEYASLYAKPLSSGVENAVKGLKGLSRAARDAGLGIAPKFRERNEAGIRAAIEAFDPQQDSLLSIKASLWEKGVPVELLANVVADLPEETIQRLGPNFERELPQLLVPMDGSLMNIFMDAFGQTGTQKRAKAFTGGRMKAAKN